LGNGIVPEIFIEKGIAYYSMQKYDDAIRIFEEFPEKFKNNPLRSKAFYYVALTQQGKGDTSDALRTFQKLIDTLPPNEYTILAHFRKGEILYGEGKYSEAAVAYREVLNLDKKNKHEDRKLIADAQYKLADSYFKANDYKNAEPAYQVVIQTNSDPKRVAEAKGRLKWIREHPK
jgi:TolA-binding protein